MMQLNLVQNFEVDEETWPPITLTFTPLLLMHHKSQHNSKQANEMAKVICKGNIDRIPSIADDQLVPTHYCMQDNHESLQELFNDSTVTKEIAEILVPLDNRCKYCFVLIEGPPGIGKSCLLKEISYRSAKKQLLQAYKLVLLISLRDPVVQQAKSIDDLLQLYFKGDKRASEIVGAISDQLLDDGGKDLTLLLDGFDELPENLQKQSLIADILKRRVLPQCGLVLSSRPHASKIFHKSATLIVEILGFTEDDRKLCIEQAFKEKPQKVKELSQYLDDHSRINSLCFIPFNMVVLLFIYQQGYALPNNSTDMYNHFICLTICRYLAKNGHPLTNTITDINNLPEPCNKVIRQLSELSLKALQENKLIFTIDELKAVCPNIEDIPGAINGFGLLQAVQHFGFTGTTLTFHFIHFSIQEYLAACHIMKLPPQEEFELFLKGFWLDNYTNTFAIYVALTKGQRPSFKRFLSDMNEAYSIDQNIDQIILNHFDYWLYLYYCFYEAGDKEMCETIAKSKVFSKRKLEHSVIVSPIYMEYLTLFVATSCNKVWVKLSLPHIQDYGLRIFHRGLKSSDVTITELWLNCGVTSSSSKLVSDIVINCNIKILVLDDNDNIGENEELYSMLSHSSTKLEILSMYHTKLSSKAANILFTTLQQNRTLKILSIEGNDITDDSCSCIANTIKLNSNLVELWMRFNPVTAEGIRPILLALDCNNTLQRLRLPDYSDDVKRDIKLVEEATNKRRASHGSQVILLIDFKLRIVRLFKTKSKS